MVKLNNNPQRSNELQYCIGMSDYTMNSLWNPNADKFKVLCRMLHVTKAAKHIGYMQATISSIFLGFFFYYYLMLLTGRTPTDQWVQQYNLKYLSQLLLAITLQLVLVGVMLYGLKTENRSALLPYIIYAAIAILAGCAQLGVDFVNLDNTNIIGKTYGGHGQFLSHFLGTMIHAWCLSVVWCCYNYFGEKKIAQRIGKQLSATEAAFQYPDHLLANYMSMPQPPPYADTVYSSPNVPFYRLPILNPNSTSDVKLNQQKPIVVDFSVKQEDKTDEKLVKEIV